MTKIQTGLVVLLIAFLGVQHSWAIAVADLSAAEMAPTNAGYSLNWDYIYNYRSSSAVAVDHYWLLTGAHVAAHNGGLHDLTIDGELYTEMQIIHHPNNADLALVRFDKPFPGYYLLHEGEISHEEGFGRNRTTVYDELIMVGFGATGIVSQTTFSNLSGKGLKRWGTNRGFDEVTFSGWLPEPGINATTSCFRTTFDLSDTLYEAGGNTGDSGGPVFIESGGEWNVAGITLYRPNDSSNGFAAIRDYLPWIKSVIVDYDTDMDGLPDWWETLYGESDAGADPDEDTFSNYEEWIADTHPNLGSSHLQLTSFSNGVDVVFSSSTNRKYQIEQNLNLTNTTWTAATGWINGSSPTTSVNLPAADSNRFYRVRAKLP